MRRTQLSPTRDRERRRARWYRPVAIGAGAALGVAGLSAPAAAVLDNYPDDPAEAGASVLMSSLMEQELLGAATSEAGFPTDPGPNVANLDVDLLGGQVLALDDIEVPIDQFADFGQLGALASESEASSPTDGRAASGLVGPDGGVTLDGEEADWGTTTIDLLSFSEALGLDGLTDLAVDQLDLELGAMGSEVIAEDGVFLDQDGGVTGPGQYIAGDASLYLHSPLIEDAAAQISDLGGQVDTTIEGIVNDQLDLSDLIGAIPGAPAPECTVDSALQENIVNAVVGEPITSANQLVTLDLSTGTAEIHLEHLVEGNDPWGGGDDAGLNGLAPNTELISAETYPQIAEGVHEIIEEAIQIMATAVQESLESVTLTCSWYQEGPLPGDVIDVTWGPINLADAAAGTFPPVETNCSGLAATVMCETIAGVINAGGPLLTGIFAPIYNFIISDEGSALYETLINDIKTGLVTETIGSALQPVFDALVPFISLQVNHQETETCVTADGAEMLSSLEVSALSLLLLGGDLGRIGLGNSGVRVDACGLALAPEISVEPTEFPAGECTEVSGTGYTPNSTVTVQLTDAEGNPVGDPVVADTDDEGAFTTELCTTEDTPPGDYTVVGTDDTTGTPAETPATILEPSAITPEISVEPTEFPAGECTEVSGTGYTPNSTVTVQLTDAEGNPVGDPVVADTDDEGAFTTELCTTEDTPPGDYTVVGTDDTTGTPAETPATILEPSAITPELVADPPAVESGEETTVTGTGYTPDSTATVQLTDPEGNPVGDPIVVDTDENGEFSTPVVVPEDAEPGEYTIVGTDDTTGTPAEAPLTVLAPGEILPMIVADPDEVLPGDETTITGTGYTPDSTATVQLVDGDGNPVGDSVEVTTDETGAFVLDAIVQSDTPPGDYTVVGTDDTTGTPAEAPLTVLDPSGLTPSLVNDPEEVVPGESTDTTGEGFTPDSTVTVQLTDPDGNPVGDPIVVDTDEDGAFTTPVTVPEDAAPGDYTVVGTDDTTGATADAPLTVTDDGSGGPDVPAITADPAEVPAGGATTTVTGENFTPEGMVTLYLQDADGNVLGEPEPFPAEADGTFEMVLNVPDDAPVGEDYTIVAIDEETDQEATTPFAITDGNGGDQCTNPTLTAPTESIHPGSEVTVTGTGFPAGVEVAVQLTDPNGDPVGDPVMVTPDESCGFEVTVTVPEDADPGLWVIIGTPEDGSEGAEVPIAVCGPDGPRSLDAWFEFGTVEQGDQQTFFASGYEPGEMVTAVIYSTSIALPAEPANADGVVSWTFTVPSDFHTGMHVGVATSTVYGDHALSDFQVTADDSSGNGDDCECDDGSGNGDDNGNDDGSGNGNGNGSGNGNNNGNGSGDGNGSGNGNGGSNDRLAATGSDAATLAGLSFLLLAAGAALIRRRQLLNRRHTAA